MDHRAIEGDRSRIIAFHMYDKNEDGLNASVHDIEKQDNQWIAHITFNGTPAKIIMYIADQVETKSYPFQINLQEKEETAIQIH